MIAQCPVPLPKWNIPHCGPPRTKIGASLKYPASHRRPIGTCRIVMPTSSVPDWKYGPPPPLVNSLQKLKIISLSWKLVPRLIWMSRNQWWWRSLFLLLSGNTFFGQIWSKNLNFQFKPKFDTNSIKTFTVLSSAGNTLLDKFDSKNQNC